MAKKEEYNLEEEVERLSRQSKINMNKSEYSFNKRLKRLDKDIDQIENQKIKDFDENKELTSEYLSIEYSHDTIDRSREKLNKI